MKFARHDKKNKTKIKNILKEMYFLTLPEDVLVNSKRTHSLL